MECLIDMQQLYIGFKKKQDALDYGKLVLFSTGG